MTPIDSATNAVRVEWLILQAVVKFEVNHGESAALEHQMVRFEEAVEELERAIELDHADQQIVDMGVMKSAGAA